MKAGTVHLVLTERDILIMGMVYEYDGCTADHIRARFFPTPGARSPCYDRIAKLVRAGYLASRRLPPLNGGIGSGPAFLTVGPQGRPILAEALGLSRTELARLRMDAPRVIAHHLAICDTHTSFALAAERSAIFTLREWAGDGELVLQVKDPKTGQEAPIIPDSTFTLALPDGVEQRFYLEQDMGTIPLKRMKTKLRLYLARKEASPPPVLWVVPDAARQAQLARWAREEAEARRADPSVFWLTSKARVSAETVLAAPIWQVVGGPPAVALEQLAQNGPDQPASAPVPESILTGSVGR